MTDTLKHQAEAIVTAIESELPAESETNRRVNALFRRLLNTINDVDMAAAAQRVTVLREQMPNADTAAIVQSLIKRKIQKTATIGAMTSGAGLIPGVGTATALVLGTAADIGATFKLQAELVLEIARAHGYPLSEQEKQRVVLLVTGLSAGASSLAQKAGQRAGAKFTEMFAEKSALKALPLLGIIASAGTNALSTYIIGQRADAYFRLGEAGMQSWQESLRAISGVDERNITRWLGERGDATRAALASQAETAIVSGKRASNAYFRGVRTFWRVTFATMRGVFQILGKGLAAPFRRVQLFGKKSRKEK